MQNAEKTDNLPSLTTLRREIQNVKVFPGFNNNITFYTARNEMRIKEDTSYNIEEDNVEWGGGLSQPEIEL